MARRYSRDKIGRFAGKGGSGSFSSARKATAKGSSARQDASMVKTLKGGENPAVRCRPELAGVALVPSAVGLAIHLK